MSEAVQSVSDGYCSSVAADAGLPGQYLAWLSTTTTNAISKLGGANGWVRTDGRPSANTQADLAAGRIFYPAHPRGGRERHRRYVPLAREKAAATRTRSASTRRRWRVCLAPIDGTLSRAPEPGPVYSLQR